EPPAEPASAGAGGTHRDVDLLVYPRTRRLAEMRSAVVQSVRSTLISRGFLEVETPVLTALHGGANARPFITHGNAYDTRLYLRIALELYLKRLVVGGVAVGVSGRPIFW